jgi:integrase
MHLSMGSPRSRKDRTPGFWHLDSWGKSFRLPPELSKNKKGRLLPLTGELAAFIKRAKARRRLDCPYIFHHNGKPIGSFRKAWKTACVAVGLGRFINDKGKKKYEGIIVHDLRWFCVRHLVQAGVGEKLAMQLTGHRTRSVFDRYNIVSDADLHEASERQQAYLASRKKNRRRSPVGRRELKTFGQWEVLKNFQGVERCPTA